MLFSNETRGILESLLFISNEPLSVSDLAALADIEPEDVWDLLQEIKAEFKQDYHGMTLLEVAGGYLMATKAIYKPYIEKLYKPQLTSLSSASLETLAIIAYKQPITRSEIELLRGVKVEKILQTLLSRNLVEEQGRKDTPGRPILYGTTTQFLQYFGLNTLADLPEQEVLPSEEEVMALAFLEEVPADETPGKEISAD